MKEAMRYIVNSYSLFRPPNRTVMFTVGQFLNLLKFLLYYQMIEIIFYTRYLSQIKELAVNKWEATSHSRHMSFIKVF